VSIALHRFCSTIVWLLLSIGWAAAQGDFIISASGVGGVRLCQPLSVVRDRFPTARDTVIQSESLEKWPAKIVHLTKGENVLFESSWIDTTHIWRASTNSLRYRTKRGYRVGTTLGVLHQRHERLRFSYAEGDIVITLVSENVDFMPDDSTARLFLHRSPTAFDSLDQLPPSTRIQEFVVNGDCPH